MSLEGMLPEDLAEMVRERDTRLTEATALLERCLPLAPPGSELRGFIRDWLRGLSRAPAQPAAPAPECPYVGRCNSSRCPVHGEPAAPEPSADFQRGYKEGSDDTARELIGNHERDNKLADAVQQAAALVDWHARAESAEAQLAAVREALAVESDDLDGLYDTLCRIAWPEMTAAAAPTGEGGKT